MESRRSFVLGAGSAVAAGLMPKKADANSRIRIAVLGVNGRGRDHIAGFQKQSDAEVAVLCDPDLSVAGQRAESFERAYGRRPKVYQDLRHVFDDKEIDAVSIATPNHWHSLAAIWACQAGKDVYVEKPASHNVWEGRKLVEASKKYERIVQHGVQLRSSEAVQEGVQLLRKGAIGKVYMARGLVYRWRPSIGHKPDEAPPSFLDYNLWTGPAHQRPFSRRIVHYNWHWHWDYGNGDTGNQGPHQFDIARWGLDEHVHPVKISSGGGLFDARGSSQETPDVHTTVFTYADGKILEFATRGIHTNDEGTQKIGNLFYGSKGWVWIDGDGRGWQSYLGRKDEKGPGGTAAAGTGSDPNVPTSIEYPHYQNFVDAIRAGDRSRLTAEIEEGHLSASLPHLANIAYQVGRTLTFDGTAEKFKDDKEADALLTRTYRAPFVIPEKV
jgi:predicted dehydrogenase